MLTVGAGSGGATVRKAVVAGSFYPIDRGQLSAVVDGHLAGVTDLPEIDGRVIALIVPHAGLIYSGPVAAYGYRVLEGRDIRNVVMCGPSHRYRFDGISVYGPFISWQTPLGHVPCNNDLCEQLIDYDKKIEVFRQAHLQEHSLEVQLPYLQRVLENFNIVPISVYSQDPATVDLLAEALSALPVDNQTILLASTDWQHYRSAAEGWPLDSLGLECLRDLDPARLDEYMRTGKVELCGGGLVVAVMKAAIKLGADKIKILKYGDSGDTGGDKSSVVGYAAAVIYKAGETNPRRAAVSKVISPAATDEKELPKQLFIDETDKVELLKIARRAIGEYLKTGAIPEFDTVPDNTRKFGAAFVTLEKGGRLRGCIGHTTAVAPLYKTVAECAVQAAVGDPRFPPVTSGELKDLHIEISVLSPMQPVTSPDEIQVGRDGLMIFRGSSRGLLLPQVAVDYGWDRVTFLEQTCVKAGLPQDAYKTPDAVLYKFQAQIFGE